MSPEQRLIAAACRWPDGPERRAHVDQALPLVRDWEALLGLANVHHVEALLAHALREAGDTVPADARESLQSATEAGRNRTLFQLTETIRLAKVLEAAGIGYRILKGVPLGQVAYGNPALKRSWDLDVLVDPDQTVTAAKALYNCGYQPANPPRKLDSHEFRRWTEVSREAQLVSPHGLIVELHWRLADHPEFMPHSPLASSARRITLLGNASVDTLDDATNLAFLALHGAMHGWARLKWLADFAAFLETFDRDRRNALLAEARALGVGRSLDQAILLARRYFGTLTDASVASDSRTIRLVQLSGQVIESRQPDQDYDLAASSERAIRASHWLIGSGWTYRRQLALARLRGSEDRRLIPLPDWLGWAYWLIRPATSAWRAATRRLSR